MKKLLLILLLIPALGVTSCVKQKDCEGCKGDEMVGWLQYAKEPVTDPFYTRNGSIKEKITAIFYDNPNDEWGTAVIGNIPKKYRTGDLIKVRACFQIDGTLAIWTPVYKLTCIENEE